MKAPDDGESGPKKRKHGEVNGETDSKKKKKKKSVVE